MIKHVDWKVEVVVVLAVRIIKLVTVVGMT